MQIQKSDYLIESVYYNVAPFYTINFYPSSRTTSSTINFRPNLVTASSSIYTYLSDYLVTASSSIYTYLGKFSIKSHSNIYLRFNVAPKK
jgi:hypothetical protein